MAAAEDALRGALQQLSEEDRVIIRMLYYQGISIADIARSLQLDQRKLYPRIQQLLTSLRKALKAQGISADVLENLDTS
jgi:DNA-directed RNA polymerase specialized sigma24 family protein